jgi:hypothetical protein
MIFTGPEMVTIGRHDYTVMSSQKLFGGRSWSHHRVRTCNPVPARILLYLCRPKQLLSNLNILGFLSQQTPNQADISKAVQVPRSEAHLNIHHIESPQITPCTIA